MDYVSQILSAKEYMHLKTKSVMCTYICNIGYLNYFRDHGCRFFQGTFVQHWSSASLQIYYAYIIHSTLM